jgi:hypothetical protein
LYSHITVWERTNSMSRPSMVGTPTVGFTSPTIFLFRSTTTIVRSMLLVVPSCCQSRGTEASLLRLSWSICIDQSFCYHSHCGSSLLLHIGASSSMLFCTGVTDSHHGALFYAFVRRIRTSLFFFVVPLLQSFARCLLRYSSSSCWFPVTALVAVANVLY